MSCFVWQKNIYFYKKGFEKLNQQYDLFVEKKKKYKSFVIHFVE